MLLLYRFFRSSEVAIWVVSTRRERDGSFDAAFLVKVKREFFVSNKELKNENKLVSRIVENDLVVCKVRFS